MMVQAKNGGDYSDFRHTLFRDAGAPEALAMFPDGRMPTERELLRYRMFRFASRIGFSPPICITASCEIDCTGSLDLPW